MGPGERAAAVEHPPGARPQLAQQLVELAAVAGDMVGGSPGQMGEGPCPGEDGVPAVAVEPPGGPGERDRAARQSTGTATSAAWVGVEQQTAATSSMSVRSV